MSLLRNKPTIELPVWPATNQNGMNATNRQMPSIAELITTLRPLTVTKVEYVQPAKHANKQRAGKEVDVPRRRRAKPSATIMCPLIRHTWVELQSRSSPRPRPRRPRITTSTSAPAAKLGRRTEPSTDQQQDRRTRRAALRCRRQLRACGHRVSFVIVDKGRGVEGKASVARSSYSQVRSTTGEQYCDQRGCASRDAVQRSFSQETS